MSDGTAQLNANGNLQTMSADSPAALAALVRQVKAPLLHILGFVADSGVHTVYFRCPRIVTVQNGRVRVGGSIRSGQGEGSS